MFSVFCVCVCVFCVLCFFSVLCVYEFCVFSVCFLFYVPCVCFLCFVFPVFCLFSVLFFCFVCVFSVFCVCFLFSVFRVCFLSFVFCFFFLLEKVTVVHSATAQATLPVHWVPFIKCCISTSPVCFYVFRDCRRQPLYYFHFDFRYVTLDIYIYIICASTRNHNNEFILEFLLRETKMADFKCQQLEIQLEFVR